MSRVLKEWLRRNNCAGVFFKEFGAMLQDDNSPAARRRVYRLGDTVRIKTGAFASFTGRIEGINQSRLLLKVAVEIFGRRAPVKLSFADVEQIVWAEDR